jgi:hypothetical protein
VITRIGIVIAKIGHRDHVRKPVLEETPDPG